MLWVKYSCLSLIICILDHVFKFLTVIYLLNLICLSKDLLKTFNFLLSSFVSYILSILSSLVLGCVWIKYSRFILIYCQLHLVYPLTNSKKINNIEGDNLCLELDWINRIIQLKLPTWINLFFKVYLEYSDMMHICVQIQWVCKSSFLVKSSF